MKRIGLFTVIFTAMSSAAWAQGCSVCTNVAQGLDDKSAHGLNMGILYLALLPLGIMGTLGVFWWRSKNSQ